jgi:hypothetical protein
MGHIQAHPRPEGPGEAENVPPKVGSVPTSHKAAKRTGPRDTSATRSLLLGRSAQTRTKLYASSASAKNWIGILLWLSPPFRPGPSGH